MVGSYRGDFDLVNFAIGASQKCPLLRKMHTETLYFTFATLSIEFGSLLKVPHHEGFICRDRVQSVAATDINVRDFVCVSEQLLAGPYVRGGSVLVCEEPIV